MIKWFSALIFTSFIINCNSVTLLNRQTNMNQAVAALAPINDFKKALPLPLFVIPQGGELQLQAPEDIVQAEIENGVMVQGTQFSLSNSQQQLFFCPSATLTELCLEPREFNNSEPLECTQELRAIVNPDEEPNRRVCNFQGNRFSSNRVIYEICDSNQYNSEEFMVYQFCFDEENAITVFTSHYILSPKLLYSPLLLREQQVEYPYEEPIDGIVPANLMAIINARNMQGRPRYRPQRLVPAEDMALGVWRKTTNKPFNFKLQHEDLLGVWNTIGQKLREQAYQHRFHSKYLVSTGVFDNEAGVPTTPTGQMYNMWIKLVIAKSTQNDGVFGGSVFFMNNFLDEEFEYPHRFLRQLQFKMNQYCPINHCQNEFKRIVENANATVKCCFVTPQIAQWFGYTFPSNLEFLAINGLSIISHSFDQSWVQQIH